MKTSCLCIIAIVGLNGCTPTVQLQAPAEPIQINLNVKIEHEIRIRVSKDLEDLFETETEIFYDVDYALTDENFVYWQLAGIQPLGTGQPARRCSQRRPCD